MSARETDGLDHTYDYALDISTPVGTSGLYAEGTAESAGDPMIYADLSTATAVTINQLRQAFQIQRLYERDARGGTRYTEVIKSHFGVTSPDARLQRPEFLGGVAPQSTSYPSPQPRRPISRAANLRSTIRKATLPGSGPQHFTIMDSLNPSQNTA